MDKDDLPPEIEHLWDTPQDQWGVDQWREYALWLQRFCVGAAEALSNTDDPLKRATELANRGLRLEALMEISPTLERSLRQATDVNPRQEPSPGRSLADARTPSDQVDVAQAFLRRYLAKPIGREAFVRLRAAKDPSVADWRGRMPDRVGQIAFKLKLKDYAYPTLKRPRRRGAPEKSDDFAAHIVEALEVRRSTTGLKTSTRQIIRGFINEKFGNRAEHFRNEQFKRLYQSVRDAQKKARRKLGKKSN